MWVQKEPKEEENLSFIMESLEPRLLMSAGPTLAGVLPIGEDSQPLAAIEVEFDRPIQSDTFTSDDVQLTNSSGSIIPVAVIQLSDTTFEIDSTGLAGADTYSLTIGPDIFDTDGNQMDQDGDDLAGEIIKDTYTAKLFFQSTTISETNMDFEYSNVIVALDSEGIRTQNCDNVYSQNNDSLPVEWLCETLLSPNPPPTETNAQTSLLANENSINSYADKIEIHKKSKIVSKPVQIKAEEL